MREEHQIRFVRDSLKKALCRNLTSNQKDGMIHTIEVLSWVLNEETTIFSIDTGFKYLFDPNSGAKSP